MYTAGSMCHVIEGAGVDTCGNQAAAGLVAGGAVAGLVAGGAVTGGAVADQVAGGADGSIGALIRLPYAFSPTEVHSTASPLPPHWAHSAVRLPPSLGSRPPASTVNCLLCIGLNFLLYFTICLNCLLHWFNFHLHLFELPGEFLAIYTSGCLLQLHKLLVVPCSRPVVRFLLSLYTMRRVPYRRTRS